MPIDHTKSAGWSLKRSTVAFISSFIFDLDLPFAKILESDEKRTLKVTKSGVWTGIPKDKYPKIVVNYDKNEVVANTADDF